MVGWSGMAPILFLIRYAIGLEPTLDGLNWFLRKEDLEKGVIECKNYWWKGNTANFSASFNNGKTHIYISSSSDFSLTLILDGKKYDLAINKNFEGEF